MLQSKLFLCAASAAAAQSAPARPSASASEVPSTTSSSPAGGLREHETPSPSPVDVTFRCFGSETPQSQRDALRRLIREHEAAVQLNTSRKDTTSSTYAPDHCSFFPFYQLASLPATTGGAHRAGVRAALTAKDGPLRELGSSLLDPWRAAGQRVVVVFGAKSMSYLKRQLAADETHSFLVIDHSLKALANAAAGLVKDFGPRVHFLRADAMFTALSVLPRASVDTVVAPMPAPFWSERGSYRRLVTSDFICAAHRVLQERSDPADPRGLVTFTDCEPYADFMVEQLTEAKLIVPWTRKNPHEAYSRWLPVSATGESLSSATDGKHEEGLRAAAVPRLREFPQQRFPDTVAVAASKSGPTSEQALSLIEGFDYKRRYYRAFNDGSR